MNTKSRVIAVLWLLLAVTSSFACTNLIVGKKASVDGSVICTYNCDGFGFASSMGYMPAGQHEKGELQAIHGLGPEHKDPYVSMPSYTYGVWKVFIKKGGRLHRIGTADKNLNIFKK